MKLEPGALLGNGKYQLTHHLGEGSQADVWGARQLGLAGFSKDVVLKCMDVGAVGPAHQQLMYREARLAASLQHPNVIEIYDVGEDEDLLYIAMEHIQGTDLEVILQHSMTSHERPIPWALATAIGIEVCKGLYYAHALAKQDDNLLNVVHRDLKPSNILLSQEGYVKVIDFGIAKAMHPKVRKDATHAGKIKGTPAYMSPEQIMEKPIDARSDLYSLGTILFELFTGRRPFQSDELFTMLIQVVQEDAPTPRTLRPDLPEEIDDIVNRLLAKKPEQRFQNARAVRRALESILRNKQLFIETEDLSAFYQSLELKDPASPRANTAPEAPGDALPQGPESPSPLAISQDALGSTSGVSYNVVELSSPATDEPEVTDEVTPPAADDDELLSAEGPSFSRVALDTSSPSQELAAPTPQEPPTEEATAQASAILPLGKNEESDTQTVTPPPETKEEEATTSSLLGLDPASLLSGGGDLFDLNDLDSIFASLEQPAEEETATSEAASMFAALTASSSALPSAKEAPTSALAETETESTEQEAESHEPAPTNPTYEPPSLHEAMLAEEAAATLPGTEEPTTANTEELAPATADAQAAPQEAIADQAPPTPTDGLTGTTLESPTNGEAHKVEDEASQELSSPSLSTQAADAGTKDSSAPPRVPATPKTEENPAIIRLDTAPPTTPLQSKAPANTEQAPAYTGGTALMASFSAIPPKPSEPPREAIAISTQRPHAATAAYPSFGDPPPTEAPKEAHKDEAGDNANLENPDSTSFDPEPYEGFESPSETSLDASPFASHKLGDPAPPMPPVATTKAAATAATKETAAEATPPPDYDMAALDDILGFDEGDRTIASPSPLAAQSPDDPKPHTLEPPVSGPQPHKPPATTNNQRISLGVGRNADPMGSTIPDGITVGDVLAEAANKRTMDEELSVEEILNEHRRQGVPVNRASQVPATITEMVAASPSPEDDLFELDEGEKTALNHSNGAHQVAIMASSSSAPRTKKANFWLWGMVVLAALAICTGLYFYLRNS